MADKNLNININVDSTQVDSAEQKVEKLAGTTKQLSKDVKIKYDINGKPIEVLTTSTLNLRTQLRALQSEFRRTAEGTAEFTLLANKINETQDELERVNQKSKDLFATLALIPGPVGEFAGRANGALSAIKLLSGFKLTDLKNQFKELGKDILEIPKNMLKIFQSTPKINTNVSGGAGVTGGVSGASAGAVGTETGALSTNSAAQVTNASTRSKNAKEAVSESIAVDRETVSENVNTEAHARNLAALKTRNPELVKTIVGLDRLEEANANLETRMNNGTAQIRLQGKEWRTLTEAETKLIRSKKDLIVTTEGEIVVNKLNNVTLMDSIAAYARAGIVARTFGLSLEGVTIAARAAQVAVATLEAALSAGLWIAIGIAIQYLYEKIDAFGKKMGWWGKEVKQATDYTKEYTAAIEKNGTALDKNLQALDYDSKKRQAIAKATAENTKTLNEEIRNIETGAFEKQKKLYSEQIAFLQGLRAKAAKDTRLDAEKKKETISNIDKEINTATKNYVDARNNIELKGLEKGAEIGEQRRKDSEEAEKMLLDLKQNNAVQLLKTEREREDKEIQLQAEAEAKKVDQLLISEKRKEELKLEIFKKYAAKILQLNEKRTTDDLAKMKEASDKEAEALKNYQKKKQEILDSASENEVAKAKAQRLTKYNDDLSALEADKNFIKASEKEKADLRAALLKAYNLDIKKINDDQKKKEQEERLKKLDDELKFLDIIANAEKNSFVAYWEDRQKILDKAKERELAETDLTEAEKLAIEKKYAQLSKDLQKEKLDAYLGYITAGLGAVNNVFSQVGENNQMEMEQELKHVKGNAEEEDKIKKKYFEKNKNIQIAQAIIGTLQGAVQAYQSLAVIPIVGPALGAAAAAAALIFGYKKVALIKSTSYDSGDGGGSSAPPSNNLGRNYGDGGMIDGPRHSQGGVPITAEGGEAVMTRGAVSMFAPLLSAMNVMGGGTSFSKGATGAARFDNPKVSDYAKEQTPLVLKTYVVSKDMQSEVEKQTRLKDLSTL
jgi:hypothetical protein